MSKPVVPLVPVEKQLKPGTINNSAGLINGRFGHESQGIVPFQVAAAVVEVPLVGVGLAFDQPLRVKTLYVPLPTGEGTARESTTR